jgi:hypothetical protein
MQRTKTRTRAKRGQWAKYNAFRAKHRELDNERRRARAAERRLEREARLCALAEEVARLPKPPRAKAGLRLRIRVEVVWPGNRESHAFTASWCPVFRRWSVPQRRIVRGIAGLMKHAPEIAAA